MPPSPPDAAAAKAAAHDAEPDAAAAKAATHDADAAGADQTECKTEEVLACFLLGRLLLPRCI